MAANGGARHPANVGQVTNGSGNGRHTQPVSAPCWYRYVQPFGFAGGLYDPDTGLVRFGARPANLTSDPIPRDSIPGEPDRLSELAGLYAQRIESPVRSRGA
jgi:hypothetical protein